jgi:aryl-alcohol dehydrogenase-like predicted oxidoreductase
MPFMQFSIPRERIIIASKCFSLVHDDPSVRTALFPNLRNSREYVNQSGNSRAAIFNAVDASLARLNTPYIDLLQIHRFDPNTPPEETMKALHDLVEQGKVRYIGASSMRTWQFAMLNEVADRRGWTKFVSMQNEYSLLYREEVNKVSFLRYND